MILVVAEQRDGVLNRATWEALAAADVLARTAAAPLPIAVVVVGAGLGGVTRELASTAVTTVFVAEDPRLDPYTPDAFVQVLEAVIADVGPTFVLFPHTYQTRDCAPRLAARLRKALITDVTAIRGEAGAALFTRPMFQGKIAAEVGPVGDAPWFVTTQSGAFRADTVARAGAATVVPVAASIDEARLRQRADAPFQEAAHAVDLGHADRIVAVGRGIKAQEHLALVERLATALRAELGASRPICDNGWVPMDRQVGSSGQTVAPKLYLALGISGAIQHVVGMKGARTIVAINKDADAPIFEVADYGIVGDLFTLVPALIQELEKK